MEWFIFNESTIIVRVLVAAILGLLIGIQRQKKKVETHSYGSAGLRTHALVCLASSLITVIGTVYFSADPARLAASIMTGIGFIGAGTIIANQGKIKGLTTAASIWTVAAIGIACGLGFYASSVIITLIVILILELRRFEKIE